jgi:6-phosphogluconolactonase (cycloisomerase 2 family)
VNSKRVTNAIFLVRSILKEKFMRRSIAVFLGILAIFGVIFGLGFLIGSKVSSVQAQGKPGLGFAAIPGVVGGQDPFGPYEVVKDWPKDISTLPGNENWTWGAGQSVYAENPSRIFLLFRGELPKIKRPETRQLPEFGPSLTFPIGRLPWRDATVAALPGAGGSGQDPDDGPKLWKGTVGVDAKWEHCLTVVDANGNIIEQWTQWDKIMKRPHFITINPYDPEKHVWVVDDHMHAIYKFSHDGKQLVQTIGTPTVKGADGTHFNRPTFLNWLPDSTLFVADGYNGTRVAKFDKDGKFLLAWGQKGNPPNDKRPGYMNNVHGMALDPQTRHVFVNDRANHRIQVFDENGKFLYDFSMGQEPSDIHLIYIGADRGLWAFDRGTSKMLKYDLEGHFLYSFGTWGDFPGGFWGVHGFSTDQDGNFYVAEVDNGRVQKFRPRAGVNPAFLVSKPVYSAWK